MRGGKFRKALGLSAALAALLLTGACDGIIKLRGRVYEQRRPGARSRAFIDRAPDDDLSGLTPLADAKVTLYHAEDYDRKKLDPSTLYKSESLTGPSGEFDASAVTAPYKFKAALVAEKPGYRPVTQLFQHGESEHTAVIILVPEAAP